MVATRQLVAQLRADLTAVGTSERAEAEKRYLKSSLEFLGVSMPKIRARAREFLKAHASLSHDELLALVDALWEARCHELSSVGVALLEGRHKTLVASDLPRLEAILRRAETWAHVDWLAVSVVGPLVASHPECVPTLRRWAQDDNFWIRRSALLALLKELREGRGDFTLFAELATPMLSEKEFFIRKAIGWILRDVSRKRPELTRDYLRAHATAMSGLTLREGAKKLCETEREALLARHRASLREGRAAR